MLNCYPGKFMHTFNTNAYCFSPIILFNKQLYQIRHSCPKHARRNFKPKVSTRHVVKEGVSLCIKCLLQRKFQF